MPGELVSRSNAAGFSGTAIAPATEWGPPAHAAPAAPVAGAGFRRSVAALKRYKWLVLPIVLLGTAIGIVATRFLHPEFTAQARVWISEEGMSEDAAKQGPIRPEGIVRNSAWIELLKSYRISDAVVMKMGLFVFPKSARDSLAFRGFTVADAFRPGSYSLGVDAAKGRWTLKTSTDQLVETGALGDSIGRKVGFRWAPPAATLHGRDEVEFTVITPREASIELQKRMTAAIPENTNFLQISLTDTRPDRAAKVLNTWLNEFTTVAAELKRRKLTEFANILGDQLKVAQQNLNTRESALQGIKVRTITLPTQGLPAAPGTVGYQDPVMGTFFQQKVELETVKRDREALEQALQSPSPTNLLAVLSVSNSPAAMTLRGAIQRLDSAQVELRALRGIYTDDYEKVKEAQRTVDRLQQRDIPQLAQQYAAQLRRQEAELGRRVGASTRDIQQIPVREIQEKAAERDALVASDLATNLEQRYQGAKLAEAQAIADVQVLDSAIAPLEPSSNSAPTVIAGSILASLALAVFIAFLLDRMDRRFRYPEQAVNDLGLTVLGAVPDLRRTIEGSSDPEDAAQVVEAFRSIRLNVRHAFESGPITLAISSPGAGEGKSLISSNLALSFAEAGYRTLLVDGDTRRGALHASFGVEQRPGLIDYLAGAAEVERVVVPTSHDNLSLIPCGSRRRQGPELLSSAAMEQLLTHVRREFDVILFDTPPFAAGIDAYALGTVARHLVVVLRVGRTDRKLAEAKLATLDRFPVEVLGAVMNEVRLDGDYQYYSYLDGYSVSHDDELPRLAAGEEVEAGR
ncbi:MAG: GumC family protein [Gemmatimonadaceae bacterium]